MSNDISWVAILGAVTGILGTLGWIINYIVQYMTKPRLRFMEGPNVKDWYFIGTPERRKFVNFEVGVKNGKTAKRCVATLEILKHPASVIHLQKQYPLHWADVPYSGSTSIEPVDIGKECHRLDVVFSRQGMNGANLAISVALRSPNQAPQAILPFGEYIMKVSIYCDNGIGTSKTISVISPENWEDLRTEEIKVRKK